MKSSFNQQYLISFILKSPLFSRFFDFWLCILRHLYSILISIEKIIRLMRKEVQLNRHNTLPYSIA